LAFTAPRAHAEAVRAAAAHARVAVTRIGRIDAAPGLRLHDARGQALTQSFVGFDHFRS